MAINYRMKPSEKNVYDLKSCSEGEGCLCAKMGTSGRVKTQEKLT